jgi:hypothetical protein
LTLWQPLSWHCWSKPFVGSPEKKKGDSGGTWAKVKFDWQIVAISKQQNVSTIYSEDPDIKKLAALVNITVKCVADLPLPPKPFSGRGELFD